MNDGPLSTSYREQMEAIKKKQMGEAEYLKQLALKQEHEKRMKEIHDNPREKGGYLVQNIESLPGIGGITGLKDVYDAYKKGDTESMILDGLIGGTLGVIPFLGKPIKNAYQRFRRGPLATK